MVTDPLADMFTRLRNGARVGKSEVIAPYSNLAERVAQVLKEEGFLGGVRKFSASGGKERGGRFFLALKEPKIENIVRLSKPGARWYVSWRGIQKPPIGIRIISTPKGIMTNFEAHKKKLGGELLGEVW